MPARSRGSCTEHWSNLDCRGSESMTCGTPRSLSVAATPHGIGAARGVEVHPPHNVVWGCHARANGGRDIADQRLRSNGYLERDMTETEHKIGTREEWQAARAELARLEAEQAARNEEVVRKRRELPWVPIEKTYEFDTADGKRTLAELFDGRSQLLIYNVMFGPDYSIGACPGCTSLADGLDGALAHLNRSDVNLICMSRAPIERLTAYKERMGWRHAYVSSYNTDFAFDFNLAVTAEQAEQIPEIKQLIDNPPDSLVEWAGQIGAQLKDGLRETPAWTAFARENGTVYHTYTVTAPDPFVAPYFSFLLERTPKGGMQDSDIRRKDEY